MEAQDVKVKVTADVAELEAELDRLRAKAEGALGGAVSHATLVKITLGLLLMVGAALLVGAYLYVDQVKKAAAADAYSKAQKDVVQAAEARLEQREKDWQKREAELEAERAAIKSAPQAVRVIEKYLPQITGQSVAQVAPAQIAPEIRQKLPDASSYVVKTEQAEVETGKAVQAGEQCKEGLAKCQKDVVDLKEAKQAVEKDRDSWEKTAKGGSKTRRALRGALIGGCAAGGAAAGAGAGSRKGAAIGALVGAVVCAIATK